MDKNIIENAFSRMPDGSGVPGRFLGLTDSLCGYEKSRFVIIPVPFEGTVSQGSGTAAGPDAIIEASRYVEFVDAVTGTAPFVYGVCTLESVWGDQPKAVFASLHRRVATVIADGKFPLILGGEHSITLGPAMAFDGTGKPFGILHLDAHTDLRESYEGEKYSHACVMRHCVHLDSMKSLVSVGVRSWSWYEREMMAHPKVNLFPAHELDNGWQQRALDKLPPRVYISLDVDVFDPSFMPATGTPEPGGMSWDAVVGLLQLVFREREVIGADIVELAPIEGLHHPQSSLAVLAHRMLAFKSLSF